MSRTHQPSTAVARQFRRRLRWAAWSSRCLHSSDGGARANKRCLIGPADSRLRNRNQMVRQSLRRLIGSASGALLAAALAGACSDALVQPLGDSLSNANDRLTIKGRVCTSVPDPNGFPVKVVFIVDQSGSMCVSDPPGSQQGSAFCERTDIQAIVPPGVTTPARVRALQRLLNEFRNEPNVYVSLVPFETNVKDVWPPTTSGQRFARPNASLDARVATLQSQLGKGTDYQGALDYTYSLIAGDIQQTARQNPAILP